MNDRNQIEEIIKETIYQNATSLEDDIDRENNTHHYMLYDEDINYISKRIKEKIFKDSVVISRAEYNWLVNSDKEDIIKENEELGKQCLDWMELYHKQITKTKEAHNETAEKIFKKVREMLRDCDTVYEDDGYHISPDVGYLMKDVDDGLDELEKQLSVDIKEN